MRLLHHLFIHPNADISTKRLCLYKERLPSDLTTQSSLRASRYNNFVQSTAVSAGYNPIYVSPPTSSSSYYHPAMSSSRTRRIAKEVADIHSDNLSNIKADPVGNGDDLTHLKGSFKGPPGTPYEGGTYIIDVKIPNDYPFRPPVMKFDTKVWHPNVSSQTVSECSPPIVLREVEANRQTDRVPSASTHSLPLGPPSLPSNPLSCPSNPFSARQNRKTHKMQRWPAC